MRDLLVVAPIETGDPGRPRAGAALARDGVFVRVGTPAECAREARPGAEAIRAGGALPGLADAHGHVALLGRWRREVRLGGAASEDECAARAAAGARGLPAGAWVRGSGWDQNRWPGGRFPGAASLTRAVPDRPAALSRVDGHALWVNAAALAAAGLGAGTPDPPGGRVVRGARGEPAGVLLDAAQELVLARIPAPSGAELEAALESAFAELLGAGLTAVHDAGVPPEVLAVYRRLAAEDRLPVRVYAMLDGERPAAELRELLARERRVPGGALLAVRAVKLYADGALGSRGAALLEDYADDPGNRGLLLAEPGALAARISAVVEAGFQPAIHAIGDRALSVVLDALERAAPPDRLVALRPRIEHLQVLGPGQLPRLVRAGAIASMQPSHAESDGSWTPGRLGAGTERLRAAHAWRTLLDAGVPLAFGSDFPVEPPDPRAGIAAAEARRGPLEPRERISRTAAVRAFTAGAAFASFSEGRRGMVREGMDADLTLFDGDPMACAVDELRALRVTHAVVAGRATAAQRSVA